MRLVQVSAPSPQVLAAPLHAGRLRAHRDYDSLLGTPEIGLRGTCTDLLLGSKGMRVIVAATIGETRRGGENEIMHRPIGHN
jgi:hypothetical protein